MDISIIYDILPPIITGVVSGWGGWFFARKKYDSEVDNNLIKNMLESLNFYDELSKSNSEKLAEVLKENNELRGEVKELRKQVFDLTMNICLDLSCAHRIKESKKIRKTKESSNS